MTDTATRKREYKPGLGAQGNESFFSSNGIKVPAKTVAASKLEVCSKNELRAGSNQRLFYVPLVIRKALLEFAVVI